MTTCQIHIADEAATATLAATLAPHLGAGDVVLLDGALAAGKTFFTRALVAAMGSDDNVSSPTYAISNIYTSPSVEIVHMDAYRLSHAKDLYHLGLDEYEDTAVWLIEWGKNVAGAFAAPLQIDIAITGEDTRLFTLSADDARWVSVLQQLEARNG